MQLTSQQITNIKWLALLTMLIDHIGYTFEFHPIINTLCRLIGRFAFIAFTFLLVYQIHHSQGKVIRKYIERLLPFLIISQLPYIAFTGEIMKLNIFGQLLAIVIFIWGIKESRASGIVGGIGLSLLSAYGTTGLILGAAIYAYFKVNDSEQLKPHKAVFYAATIMMGVIVTHFFWFSQINIILFMIAGGGSMYILLNGNKLIPNWNLPQINKWWFYAFYPAHISVLALLFYISM